MTETISGRTTHVEEVQVLSTDQKDNDQLTPVIQADESVAIKKPPDGGWGWLCVLGCSTMHMLLGGLTRSYGVLYLKLLDQYGSTSAATAWIGGLAVAIRLGLSPLATSCSVRFTARKVVMTGGFLLGSGCILSVFAPNLYFLFFSYGIVGGLGGTLIYSPAIVIVGQYFDKRRGKAVGLSSAGSGLGAFAFPPFMEYLFESYSYFGAMLILGAIMFNNCVCGALYRPPHWININEKKMNIHEQRRMEMENKEEVEPLNCEDSAADTLNKCDNNTSQLLEKECIPGQGYDQSLPPNTVNHKSRLHKFYTKVCKKNKYLDLSLLLEVKFLLIALSYGFMTLSYMTAQMLLPAHAEHYNIIKYKAVWLLSAVGITDTAARVMSGIVFDISVIKNHRRHIYNIAVLLSGSTNFFWALSRSFTSFMIISIIHGLTNGIVVAQRSVIVADLLGIQRLSSSFGLTLFVQGTALLVGPAVGGYLKDITGSYDASYYYLGAAGVLAAVLMACINISELREKNQERKNDKC